MFSTYTAILITFACTSIIAFYCPIEHKNKPIPTNRRKLHKIMSILLSLSYGIVGTTLTVLSNKYGVLILLTLLLVTVLVKKGGVKELKMKTKTATAIKAVAGKMAKISCNAASIWGMYQPKEPKMKK